MKKIIGVLFIFLLLVSCAPKTEPVPEPVPEPEKENTALDLSPEEVDVFFLEQRREELEAADTINVHLREPLVYAELLRFFQGLKDPEKRQVVFFCGEREYDIDLSSLAVRDDDWRAYWLDEIESTGTVNILHHVEYGHFKVLEDRGEDYVLAPANTDVSPEAVFTASYDRSKYGTVSPGDLIWFSYLWKDDYLEKGEYELMVFEAMRTDDTVDFYSGLSEDEIAYAVEKKRLEYAQDFFDFAFPDGALLADTIPFDFRFFDAERVTYHWRGQTYTLREEDVDFSWFDVMHLYLYLPWIFEKQDFTASEVEVNVARIETISEGSWSGIATLEGGFHKADSIDSSLPLPSGSKVGDYVEVIYTYNKDNGEFTFLHLLPADGPEPVGAAKPVIYLYPEEETEVSVRLSFPGELGTTYPKYEGEWRVTASPDGLLKDEEGREYSYLFYEGDMQYEFDLSDAACVKREDLIPFLQGSLEAMGLTPKEYNDFIVYWLPYLEEYPYDLISFKNEVYDGLVGLTVEPKPDSVLRVYMVFKGIEEAVEGKELEIPPFERKGFTVVEWGGTQLP